MLHRSLNRTFECYDSYLTECSDGTYNTYLGLGNGTLANRAWSHTYEEYCQKFTEPPPEPGQYYPSILSQSS